MMAGGTAMQAISAFYAAKSQKRMLRMKAKELEFQQTMAEMNARRSEQEAESILRAGQAQAMQQTMQAGQVRASQKAGLAAKGIEAGLGTMMDILKSTDVIKDIDLTTINDNSARAAAAARLRTSDIRIQGTLLGAQSKMAMAAAGAVSPVAGVMTSLLSGGGQAATLYAQEQRAARYYSSLNPNAAGYNPRLAD
jgi:hypothetical protein